MNTSPSCATVVNRGSVGASSERSSIGRQDGSGQSLRAAGEAMPSFDGHGDMARPVAGGVNNKKAGSGGCRPFVSETVKKSLGAFPWAGVKIGDD
jgi:hypothetical protein